MGQLIKRKSKLSTSFIRRCFQILTREERRKVLRVAIAQIALGLLDLAAITAIGVLGALGVTGIQSREPGNRVSRALELLGIADFRFQTQMAIIGSAAAIILVFRTLVSMALTRKILHFLSHRAANLSTRLVANLLSRNILEIQQKGSQETLYALTSGVNILYLNIVGTVVGLTADVFLAILLSLGLFVVDPIMSIGSFLLFAGVGFVLYAFVQKRAAQLGSENAQLAIQSSELIMEVMGSYRELFVRNRRGYYSRKIGLTREILSSNSAELAFMPNVGKYFIEIAMVVGAILISAIQFLAQDATHAISTLTVFLAAASRIAPAVLRIQTGAVTLKSNMGAVGPTLDLIRLVGTQENEAKNLIRLDTMHSGFTGSLKVDKLEFTYPGNQKPTLQEISLQVPAGSFVAVVGPSGAGKTTLIDLVLGILIPNNGVIEISGISPIDAIEKWPGALSYVPQEISYSNSTIFENVGFGYDRSEIDPELVEHAIKLAQLSDLVNSLPEGIHSRIGENATKLSGGQRQRLGIARALYTKPKLLVLDEATSSLDGQTELDISDALSNLKGQVTLVTIAHRLSTVRNADIVIYLENGKIVCQGTFNEVRSLVPNFDAQAKLMGL